MTRPRRDTKSGIFLFVARVPADLLDKAPGGKLVIDLPTSGNEAAHVVEATVGRVHVKFSLRTRDADIARQRAGLAHDALCRLWQSYRSGVKSLSHKEAVALSGFVYRELVDRHEDNPQSPEQWAAFKAFNRAVAEGRTVSAPAMQLDDVSGDAAAYEHFGDDLTAGVNRSRQGEPSLRALEGRFGAAVDNTLARRALRIDAESRFKLLKQIALAANDAGWRLKRNAQGDYSPDPKEQRFPSFVPDSAVEAGVLPPSRSLSLDELVKLYIADRVKSSPATARRYRPVLAALVAFLPNKDAASITQADLRRFKKTRLSSARSERTVETVDLVAVKSLFNWAVNGERLESPLLSANPASSVKVRSAGSFARHPTRQGFYDDEAAMILSAALKVPVDNRNPTRALALRWCPWIAAYTGARIASIAALASSDIRQEGGSWFFTFPPAKGFSRSREVPVHADLIERGFLSFIKSREQATGLFYDEDRRIDPKAGQSPAERRAADVSRWVRRSVGVIREGVDPNHGWRHTFKSRALGAGIEQHIRDAITGHATGQQVARAYEHVTLGMLTKAMEQFPRYRLNRMPSLTP